MPTQKVLDQVLSALSKDHDYGAFELLNALRAAGTGISEAEIKEALSFLINDHQLIMTPERKLRAAAHA